MFWQCFWKTIEVNVFYDVLRNAKHRANDASNDVNRPPLSQKPVMAEFCICVFVYLYLYLYFCISVFVINSFRRASNSLVWVRDQPWQQQSLVLPTSSTTELLLEFYFNKYFTFETWFLCFPGKLHEAFGELCQLPPLQSLTTIWFNMRQYNTKYNTIHIYNDSVQNYNALLMWLPCIGALAPPRKRMNANLV